MSSEFCLIHRDKGSTDDFEPAPYTVGWTHDECMKQLPKYREIDYESEWEIGIREVSPWCLCRSSKKPEAPTLPGLEIVKESENGQGNR